MNNALTEIENDAGAAASMIGSRIKFGAILVLIVALCVVGWLYRKEIRASAELAHQVLQQQMAIDDMNQQLKDAEQKRRAAERIAADHMAKLARTQQQARKLHNEIEQLKKNRPSVAAWAARGMPDAVFDRLLPPASPDADPAGLHRAAGSVSDRPAGAESSRADQR